MEQLKCHAHQSKLVSLIEFLNQNSDFEYMHTFLGCMHNIGILCFGVLTFLGCMHTFLDIENRTFWLSLKNPSEFL